MWVPCALSLQKAGTPGLPPSALSVAGASKWMLSAAHPSVHAPPPNLLAPQQEECSVVCLGSYPGSAVLPVRWSRESSGTSPSLNLLICQMLLNSYSYLRVCGASSMTLCISAWQGSDKGKHGYIIVFIPNYFCLLYPSPPSSFPLIFTQPNPFLNGTFMLCVPLALSAFSWGFRDHEWLHWQAG